MFQKIFTFLIIFLTVIIQISVFPHFFPPGLVPDLALILAIIWTVDEGFERSLWRIVILGLVLDLLSFWPVGFNVIALVLISYATSFLAKRFLISPKAWKLLFILSVLALGTLAYHIIINILLLFFNSLASEKLDNLILRIGDAKIIFKVACNLLALFLIYWPLKKTEEFLSFYNRNNFSQAKIYRR
jgi:rod shape-determining protein MreD